jgi:hypothetical protein
MTSTDHAVRDGRTVSNLQLMKRVALMFVATALFLLAVQAPTNQAGATVVGGSQLCGGVSYSNCTNAGYTDHGYAAASGQSYWTQYPGHNCTNYVAFLFRQSYPTTPVSPLNSAAAWASRSRPVEWCHFMTEQPQR